jgi:hypothetical protein
VSVIVATWVCISFTKTKGKGTFQFPKCQNLTQFKQNIQLKRSGVCSLGYKEISAPSTRICLCTIKLEFYSNKGGTMQRIRFVNILAVIFIFDIDVLKIWRFKQIWTMVIIYICTSFLSICTGNSAGLFLWVESHQIIQRKPGHIRVESTIVGQHSSPPFQPGLRWQPYPLPNNHYKAQSGRALTHDTVRPGLVW